MLFDKIINTLFSLGAAIVIFGAWAKIESKEFATTALTIGLMTETAIFCIYGILEWRRQPSAKESPAPPAVTGTPVHKENVEELTDSIRQTVQVLNRIFRA
ncbi:MAG: hypothetical protein JST42_26245 [Bacteroidetes bacterium]|nr:hypothetical protein [Bacteroidota bacterium]